MLTFLFIVSTLPPSSFANFIYLLAFVILVTYTVFKGTTRDIERTSYWLWVFLIFYSLLLGLLRYAYQIQPVGDFFDDHYNDAALNFSGGKYSLTL